MTRKRFVKLLMADGYSRNQANSIARETAADGYTYDFQLLYLRVQNDFPDFSLKELKSAIKKIADAIIEIIPTVISAIVEAFPVALDRVCQRIAALQEEMEASNQ